MDALCDIAWYIAIIRYSIQQVDTHNLDALCNTRAL